MSDWERARAFLRDTYRRRVEYVESYPWGELVITPSLPRVYDANFAIVERWAGDAAGLRREMNRVQSEHGFAHRKVVLADEDLAAQVWSEFEQPDWPLRHRSLVMAHARAPDRAPDTSIEVLTVGDDAWEQGRRALIELEVDGSDPEVSRQLLDLDRRLAAAMDVRHVAALVNGEIASYAGVYLDDGVAQIEDVATLPTHRRQGLARAVMLHAMAEARRAGAGLVFLMADEADWPQEFYGRLGFDPIGVEHVVGRPGERDT